MKKKVLIVDDSLLIRQILTEIIDSSPELEVVGTAVDPYDAREKIKQLDPDVLTLDIEMPKMDGISFLRNLMRLRPMPVVMISTLTAKGAPATLEALELGAIDYLAKPKSAESLGFDDYAFDIIEKVTTAANANLAARQIPAIPAQSQPVKRYRFRPQKCIVIGASTGGTEAIRAVLACLPTNCPPVLVSQHIPPVFSASFADRMNRICSITVYEARDGMQLEPGTAYIAPGDYHLTLVRKGQSYICRLNREARVNRHRPSVEVLFDSALNVAGVNCVGVLLTGMGDDGAQALLRMRKKGCFTIAQDEQTSVVWGMPGVAVKLGAAESVLPLQKIPGAVLRKCKI